MNCFKKYSENIKKMPIQTKAALVYTIASFITRGFHFITTPLFTRIMTVEQIGIVSNYSTWSSFISTVATLGLTSGAINIALKEFKEDRPGYLKSSQTLVLVGVTVVGIITSILYPFLIDIIRMPFNYIVLMLVCMFFSASKSFWMSWQRYEYHYKAVGIVTVGAAVLSAFVAVIAVVIAKNNGIADLASVRLYSSSVVTLAFSIPFFVIILCQRGTIIHKEYSAFAIRVGTPMIIHTLAKSLLSASDRTMINAIVGAEALGYYSVLYTLSSLALMVWEAINASLVPYIFEKLDEGKRGTKSINQISIKMLAIFACCSMLLTLFAPEIIRIIASEKYMQAIYVMPPIATGIFFTALYSLYADIIMYQKKTTYIMFCTMGAALFNVVTNYIFIKQFGYVAAAYTTLASYLLLALIYCIVSRRLSEYAIFDEKKIWLLAGVVVLGSLACNVLYLYTIIRYFIILFIIVIVVVFRKKILYLFKFMRNKD